MDSERRHELETNDLREFFENFKDFWDKHGNRLLLILIVGLGGWLGYSRYNQWQADKADSAYSELDAADSADAFRAIAGEHSKVHDEAMRRGGDTALGDARQALVAADQDAAEAALKQAGAAYTALTERAATVEYKLVGQEGLAKVALMREEWDKAASHYEQVIELAGDAFVTQADRANRSLERMDLLKSPIAFAPPEDVDVDIEVDNTAPPAIQPDLLNDVPVFPNLPSPGDQLVPSDDLPAPDSE